MNRFVNMIEYQLSRTASDRLLDIGCGNGSIVKHYVDKGFDIVGIDIEFKRGNFTDRLIADGKLRKIGSKELDRASIQIQNTDYCWPIKSNEISFAFSKAVIEHVENLDEFANENFRVLKGGGVTIHYFPSKYALIEPHTGVIFGGIIQNRYYYQFMCKLWLCFKSYRGKGLEASEFVYHYTSYRGFRELAGVFRRAGFDVTFNESLISTKVKFFSIFFRYLRSTVMVLKKIDG